MYSRMVMYLSCLAFLVIPLAFWTITPNFVATPKESLLYLVVLLLLLGTAFSLLKERRLTLPTFKDSLPLIIFGFAISASLLFNPEGRPEAISGKGLTLLTLALYSLFLLTISGSKLRSYLETIFVTTGSILSIHSLLSLTFLSKSLYLPTYMQNIAFTPTGGYPTTLLFILICTSLLILKIKIDLAHNKYLSLFLLLINIVAGVAILSLMLPGGALALQNISFTASWSIALDALKSLRSLLFGIGLSNYSLLFASVKPLAINATGLWNTIPLSGSSELLTILPTAGILTTLSLLYLMGRTLFTSHNTIFFIPTILLILSFLFLPASLSTYLILFTLYGATISTSQADKSTHSLDLRLALTLALCLVILSIAIATPASKSLASEYFMRQAQRALDANDSQKVYELHARAISISPKITNYHLSFADVNFRLASALSQKESPSDSDRETITRLVQQSIESGKTAITLRPNDSRNWLAVAKIYQNLINVADGADNFALDIFGRAISLDRANPSLRLEYATLLSQLADLQPIASRSATLRSRAIAELQTAIQLKNDYANAYYNLAKIYEKGGDQTAAIKTLEQTLKYLDPTSTDYGRVTSELETLKNQSSQTISSPLPTPEPLIPLNKADTDISTPSPLPSPLEGGPIEVPTPQ